LFVKIIHNKLKEASNTLLVKIKMVSDNVWMIFIDQKITEKKIAKREEKHIIYGPITWYPRIECGESCKS